MALTKGGAKVQASPYAEIEEVPAGIPRGRGQKPKIRKMVDGVETDELVEYTRASSLGKVLENQFLIHRAQIRKTVFGMSRRPDLVLKAAAIETATEKADKVELSTVAEAAMTFAGEGWAATSGSALHRMSEQMDAGKDLSHLPEQVLAALHRYRELMSLVYIVASETFVVCDSLQAAGTYDRVIELLNHTEVRYTDVSGIEWVHTLPAGTRLILDLKTNKDAMYFGAVYECQEAVYGNGVPYTAENGRGEWPDGLAPNNEWGLILHLPIESLEDAGWYWVDLRHGYTLAQLAEQHRIETSVKSFWPTDLEPMTLSVESAHIPVTEDEPDTETLVELDRLISEAGSEAELTALWVGHQDVWTEVHSAAAKARADELVAVAKLWASDPPTVDMTIGHLLVLVQGAESEDVLGALWEGNKEIWCEKHSIAAKARIHDLYSDDPEAAGATPTQVVKTGLMRALKAATTKAELDGLWESNQGIWDDLCTAMVKARMRELA